MGAPLPGKSWLAYCTCSCLGANETHARVESDIFDMLSCEVDASCEQLWKGKKEKVGAAMESEMGLRQKESLRQRQPNCSASTSTSSREVRSRHNLGGNQKAPESTRASKDEPSTVGRGVTCTLAMTKYKITVLKCGMRRHVAAITYLVATRA